jgi:hypothetical protein
MKQFLFSALALTLGFSVISCSDPDEDNGEQNNPDETNQELFVGQLTVEPLSEHPFVMDSVSISMAVNDSTGTMTMVMYKVRFSPSMPITLDMTVTGIDAESNQGVFILSADSIVPQALGGPFPAYTISNLNGVMTDDSLHVSMNCGSYPLTFRGGR